MRRHWNLAEVAPPAGAYSQAVLVEGSRRLLCLSGLLPVLADGSVPPSFEGQMRAVLAGIDEALREARLERADLVKLTTFLVDMGDRPAFMAIRDSWVPMPPPASTLVAVSALAHPACRLEIEAMAAA